MPIQVTTSATILDTRITQALDTRVTSNGDTRVAQTNVSLPDTIKDVSISGATISQVYITDAGGTASLYYQIPPAQVINILSSTDVDLLTILNASPADPNEPVVVNIADGQVLGGVSSEALTLTGLGAYASITINLAGQCQGSVGVNAIRSDQNLIITGLGSTLAEIKGGISDATGGTTSSITIVLGDTSKILAGGGDGGMGGVGGNGDDSLNKINNGYTPDFDQYIVNAVGGTGITYFSGTKIGQFFTRYGMINNFMYEFGLNISYNIYEVIQGSYVRGVVGIGGNGGLGQGYLQDNTNGSSGGAGTNRAGSGGDGGNGGTWGANGADGLSGETGLYYSPTSSNAQAAGASGALGATAGFSIITTGTVIYQ